MKYKCIIFDCDGVLVNTEEISNTVLCEMANKIGVKLELEFANKQFAGKSMNSIFEFLEKVTGEHLPANFELDYRKRTFDLFKTDVRVIEGIYELLDKISIPYCVASSGPLEKMKITLKTTNLIERFRDNIFSCYEINSWKPDPEIFIYASEKMGFAPSDCVVVEDSLSGIVAAKRGGFDVFGFGNTNNQKAFADAGAKVFFEMHELYDLLSKA